MARDWLWLVLTRLGVPDGELALFRALYAFGRVFGRSGGMLFFLFRSAGGVAQGCPLSGVLFVMAFDGPLRLLDRAVGPGEWLSGCADDVATVVLEAARLAWLAAGVSFDFFFKDLAAGMSI